MVGCVLTNPVAFNDHMSYAPAYNSYKSNNEIPIVPIPKNDHDVFLRKLSYITDVPNLTPDQQAVVVLLNTISSSSGGSTALLDSVRV